VSAALVNYEVKRHDRLSSFGSTLAKTLAQEARVPIGRAKVIVGGRSPGQISEILRRISSPSVKS